MHSAIIVTSLVAFAAAQAPNTLGNYNPNLRTASYNATFFIVAVPKDVAQDLVPNYNLLPVPTTDTTLFPNGFDTNEHPVLVASGFQNDIRMTAVLPLQIQALLGGQISVPYVDRLGDGKSAFQWQVNNYIGGIDGQNTMSLVPALVGSAEGTPAVPATFDPNDQAYLSYPTGEYSSLVKQIVVFNPISGPSVQGEAFDLYPNNEATTKYTAHAFHALNNQPLILQGVASTMCLRNNYYFNDTQFMMPALRSGSVTFGTSPVLNTALGTDPYEDQGAYAAVGQIVGQNPESCQDAIANNDPFASL